MLFEKIEDLVKAGIYRIGDDIFGHHVFRDVALWRRQGGRYLVSIRKLRMIRA
jgi:hypothetical protein